MTDLLGQRIPTPEDIGVLPLSDAIGHVVGTTETYLAKPAGKHVLCLFADKNGFRIRLGDFHSAGMPSTEFPVASVTVATGTGAMYLAQGASMSLPGPNGITVKGYDPASVLTYYWL